jgi:PRC-barrel domain
MERHEDRDRRDAAGVGPFPRDRDQLVSLSSLSDWNVSEGEPDIRGWEIRAVSGKQLGRVADLLVDTAARQVVLIDANIAGRDRNVLVPIRAVHLDRSTRVVLVDSTDLEVTKGDMMSSIAGGTDVRSESEIVVNRPAAVEGDTARRRPEPPGGRDAEAERKEAEKRRIDRLSTDL